MKKTITILVLFICVSILNADIGGGENMITDFENSLKLKKNHFNGLLESTIIFSQEDYDVEDYIDITIHFEVNTEENVENHKFAVTDFKNKVFYSLYKRHYDTITQEDKDTTYNNLTKKDTLCKFIESDPDLVLSNNQPKGVYHLKFKLTKKVKPLTFLDENYPYVFRSLRIVSYSKSESYERIKDYIGVVESLTIAIKINSSALKKGKHSNIPEIKSIPANKPKRIPEKTPVQIFEDNGINRIVEPGLRIEQRILSGKTTYLVLDPEPVTLDYWNPGLAGPNGVNIVTYEVAPNVEYDCIEIQANTHEDFTGMIWYYGYDDEGIWSYCGLFVNIINSYDLHGYIKMWHYGYNYVDGNGTMQKVDSSGSMVTECPLDDDGLYILNDFSPDDDIRYVAKNEENGVVETFILEYYDDEVIVSNSAFGLDPQTVYYLLNDDDSQLNIFYYNGPTTYQNHIYYLSDIQLVADNLVFDSQKRAEEFSQDFLSNLQRELLYIYADLEVHHPGVLNSCFIPVEQEPGLDYDYDFVQLLNEDIQQTSVALHELGHAQHWHHAGFSL